MTADYILSGYMNAQKFYDISILMKHNEIHNKCRKFCYK